MHHVCPCISHLKMTFRVDCAHSPIPALGWKIRLAGQAQPGIPSPRTAGTNVPLAVRAQFNVVIFGKCSKKSRLITLVPSKNPSVFQHEKQQHKTLKSPQVFKTMKTDVKLFCPSQKNGKNIQKQSSQIFKNHVVAQFWRPPRPDHPPSPRFNVEFGDESCAVSPQTLTAAEHVPLCLCGTARILVKSCQPAHSQH